MGSYTLNVPAHVCRTCRCFSGCQLLGAAVLGLVCARDQLQGQLIPLESWHVCPVCGRL